MVELKTKPNEISVAEFLVKLDDGQRHDSELLIEILSRVTGDPAVMWGSSIIGFGNKHLVYESGRELDWMVIGFSPRKGKIALYCPGKLEDQIAELYTIGKYKTGKSCIYIAKLADVDIAKLESFLGSTL
jgi:hypothetical protein